MRDPSGSSWRGFGVAGSNRPRMGGLAYSLISTGRGTPSSATAIPSTLTGSMAKYVRGINNRRFDMNNPYDGTFDIKVNERVRWTSSTPPPCSTPCTCTATPSSSPAAERVVHGKSQGLLLPAMPCRSAAVEDLFESCG